MYSITECGMYYFVHSEVFPAMICCAPSRVCWRQALFQGRAKGRLELIDGDAKQVNVCFCWLPLLL